MPRKAAERHFQAAGPIDTYRIRVLALPVLPLLNNLRDKFLVVRQPVCLRQSYQMLMAVQFPDDFAVAYFFKIEISNFVKQLPRRSFPMYRVAVPIDVRPIIQSFVTEQIELAPAHPFGSSDDFICQIWEALFQHRAQTWNRGWRKEKQAMINVCR